jgi:hypothetical protein
MVTRGEWVNTFLIERKCRGTPENMLAVLTWIRSENGGNAPVGATWNPLNTTLSLPPQSNYNSIGVKNYETFEQGILANSRTLALGYYPEIRRALEAGDDARRTIAAIHASPWGSKPNAGTLAYVRNNLAAETALVVGRGAVTPGPVTPTPGPGPVGGTMYLAPVAHPTKLGYWCVDAEGHVLAYGASQYHGGQGAHMKAGVVDPTGAVVALNGPCVGLAPTPSGNGYWLLTDVGSIYDFGDAQHFGDPAGNPKT